jgi:phosphoserine aminotransferase
MARIHNFNAGPAAIPLAVLKRAQSELLDYRGTGMSIMEHSHRGRAYEEVHRRAIALVRELLNVGENYEVLLLQGGASLQFAMLPLNLLHDGQSGDYIITGAWAQKAYQEAQRAGRQVRIAADPGTDGVFTRVPSQSELELDPDAAYVHYTTNNTIFGTQFQDVPDTGKVPLIADMSSDFLWRPFDINQYGVVYAGTQKNVGPSGLVIVIMRKDLLASARSDLPNILRYSIHADKGSLYNTPNSFGIYMMMCALEHLADLGGLEVIERRNRGKAELLYDAIDTSDGYYRCPTEVASRSTMNVVFRLASEDLEKRFIAGALEKRLQGLKGHRSVGGVRASIYNAVERSSVEMLVGFMHDFKKTA